MLYDTFLSLFSGKYIYPLVLLFSFFTSWCLLAIKFDFLPKDQGREFAVNGELSKGKIRGVGLIMTFCLLLCSAIFVPFSTEFWLYALLIVIEMISGYMDDASSKPWSDYKKGLIDFIVSAGMSAVFIKFNTTNFLIGNIEVSIPSIIFWLISTIFVWISINATNCSDGVDGLCATVSVVSLISFLLIYSKYFSDEYKMYNLIMIGIIFAYLLFNTSPSSMLMGDAGSRSIGVFIALIAMKSMHPLSYLLIAFVLIIDGLAGLIKIFMKRFLKISILKNIRTPIHDHVRKNLNWSDTQVVIRFSIIQGVFSTLQFLFEALVR